MGTKACENAPSAKRRRRIFGNRNAASNASICSPAPNANALRLSRASPAMRESRVSALTVESVLSRFIVAQPHDRGRRPIPELGKLTQIQRRNPPYDLRESRRVAIMLGLFQRLQQT